MIHILEEHFHEKGQVLRCLLLLANVMIVDYAMVSLWFISYVTGILCIVFRSGGAINPEITTLELLQTQHILYKFLTTKKAMFIQLQLSTE